MSSAAAPVLDISHIVVKASMIPALDLTLAGIFPLTPPPSPKGRYALAKAAKAIGPAHQLYNEQRNALLALHAVKVDGQPVTQQVNTPTGLAVQYDLGEGFGKVTAAYLADLAALNDESITLSGVRMITRAELGQCPITVQHEAVLLGVLLVDEEPTE